MNPQIRRLFLVFALLFVALIGMSSYWLWRAPELEARQGNPNLVVRQLTIERGPDLRRRRRASSRANRKRKVQGETWYLRRYPQNGLTAQHGRLLDDRALAHRAREVAERLPDRLERRPLDARRPRARRPARAHAAGQRRRHDARRARPAGRDAAARRASAARSSRSSPRPARVARHRPRRPTYDPNLVETNFGRDRPARAARASRRRRSSTARRRACRRPCSSPARRSRS